MKDKLLLANTVRSLSRHQFSTSKYIILDSGVRRDASTGRLIEHKAAPKTSEKKGRDKAK